jgi:dihydrofolate reductase
MSREISLISAVAENGVIGREGDLPWRLKDDMRWFMRRTRGGSTIMGRRTFESMDGPLPDRQNIVLTSREDWSPEGVLIARSIEDAIAKADRESVFIIGGESVYRAGLPYATRLDLTRVHAEVEGDTRFPEVDFSKWERVSADRRGPDAENDHPFTIEVWTRAEPETSL